MSGYDLPLPPGAGAPPGDASFLDLDNLDVDNILSAFACI
jgi:hypothetical protein